MVPVDSPENKGHHSTDKGSGEGHKMVMHQLTNLHKNAGELLQHLSECTSHHMQEEWVKKKIILATDYLDSVRDYVMSSHGGEMKADKGDGFLMVVEKMMTKPKP